MEPSSSLLRPKPLKHHVYLSFGEDTRWGFSGHLERSLDDRGFSIREDNLEAIKESKIFIVVLSEGYARSLSNLDEFSGIVKFAEVNYRWILLVFYHLNPSDARHQTGSVGQALAALQNTVSRERLNGWIKALKEGADTIGWHMIWARDKYEHQYIEEILQRVSEHVACTIGLYPRVQEFMRYLDSGSADEEKVDVVVLWGESGGGKTTLAHGVSHCIAGNSFYRFIAKAREYLSEPGLLRLQQELLSKIVGKNVSGMSIKSVLKQNKIFLIIEDVDDPEHLKFIVELTNWFGSGSKVIITAQDYHLLERHGIKRLYEIKRFEDEEAYTFLNLKIFKSRLVKPNFVSIIKRAATYASGNPLRLELIGSNLSGKEKKECESTLDRYEKIPNKEPREMIRVTYDDLEEHQQQVLDYIACELEGQKLTVVEGKLKSVFSGCPKKDIKVLRDKFLIKINEHDRITLHDLTLDIVKCKLFGDISKENMEYGRPEIQPASSDGTMISDPMELELSYQHFSFSSSQDSL